MHGTEKQVKWAESIKAEALKEIDADIYNMSVAIMTEGGEGALFLAEMVECLEEARTIDSAAWWIDCFKSIRSGRNSCWAGAACGHTRAGYERSARTRQRWIEEWNEKLEAADNEADRRHYRSLIKRDEAELKRLTTADPIPARRAEKKNARVPKKGPWIHPANTPERVGLYYKGK